MKKNNLPYIIIIGTYSCDRLASAWGVSRADQDLFAMQSHTKAAKATADGLFDEEIIPTAAPPQV